MHKLSGFNHAKLNNIPPIELHHGFNILKKNNIGIPPIALEDLAKSCKENGLENGGWFIFAHEKFWQYRTNEFYYGNLENAKTKIFDQASRLKYFLKTKYGQEVDVSFSMERVHGIWQF